MSAVLSFLLLWILVAFLISGTLLFFLCIFSLLGRDGLIVTAIVFISFIITCVIRK